MAMREECRHFQSRTYSSGEVARFCVLDLAPEAPWRCPEDCPAYEPRLADVGWTHGPLVEPPVEEEPAPASPEVFGVLEEAEEIVTAAVPDAIAEERREQRREQRREGRGASGGRRGWWPRRRGSSD